MQNEMLNYEVIDLEDMEDISVPLHRSVNLKR